MSIFCSEFKPLANTWWMCIEAPSRQGGGNESRSTEGDDEGLVSIEGSEKGPGGCATSLGSMKATYIEAPVSTEVSMEGLGSTIWTMRTVYVCGGSYLKGAA